MQRPATAALAASLALAAAAPADPGDPLAVRWWGQALVTIETHWDLTVAIDPYHPERIGYADPGLTADLVLITHAHFDHDNPGLIKGAAHVEHGLDDDGKARAEVSIILDRAPNQPKPTAGPGANFELPTPSAIRATSIASFHDDSQGSERGENAMWLIEADGVRILHCGDLGHALTHDQLAQIGEVDVLLIPVGGVYTIDGAQAAAVTEQVKPRYVLPIHYKTDRLNVGLEPVDAFVKALPERYQRRHAVGNTLAVSEGGEGGRGATRDEPQLVLLKDDPWTMPPELADLFDKKEAAAAASQQVFQPLSTNQMNHRPSNGTHTPRWNVEHMAGRELGFFSSGFSKIDPAVPHMNENPQQMPPDYVAAHPDWDGAEEARRIHRIQRFTRRFAYLLHEHALDDTLEGAPRFVGTPGALLNRMIAHWSEHTENVEEKFELEDWPAE